MSRLFYHQSCLVATTMPLRRNEEARRIGLLNDPADNAAHMAGQSYHGKGDHRHKNVYPAKGSIVGLWHSGSDRP